MQGLASTTTNRLAMLRLGSTTATTIDDSAEGTVLFSDPCSCCGSMKRRSSSPFQESPPRNKKILIESPSSSMKDPTINTVSSLQSKIHHSDQFQPNPFIRLIPNSSFTTPASPSLPFIRTSNSAPFTASDNSSEINNSFNSLASNSPPVSFFNSKLSLPYMRRCNSAPVTSSENSSEININVNSLPSTFPPVSFSNPKSPENFALTQTPPSNPVAYLDRINSFSSSCGSEKSTVEESPVVIPSLPPRPSICRSFSDVNPCVTPASTLNSDEMTTLTASGQSGQINGSGGTVISDGDNPGKRRWKRMRKSLKEMNKWLNDIIEEQNKEEQVDNDNDDDDDDDGEEKKIDTNNHETHETLMEENVTAEIDGEAMKVRYICSCGKHYQIAISI